MYVCVCTLTCYTEAAALELTYYTTQKAYLDTLLESTSLKGWEIMGHDVGARTWEACIDLSLGPTHVILLLH